MKKAKRILAITGVILLLCLYLSTLVFALLGESFLPMLKASIAATIIVPILLWAYTLVYKLMKEKNSNKEI